MIFSEVDARALKQPTKKFQLGLLVATILGQDIEDVAFVVDVSATDRRRSAAAEIVYNQNNQLVANGVAADLSRR